MYIILGMERCVFGAGEIVSSFVQCPQLINAGRIITSYQEISAIRFSSNHCLGKFVRITTGNFEPFVICYLTNWWHVILRFVCYL